MFCKPIHWYYSRIITLIYDPIIGFLWIWISPAFHECYNKLVPSVGDIDMLVKSLRCWWPSLRCWSSKIERCLISVDAPYYIGNIWYNLCTPFKHDIRRASLCGFEFVVTMERREKRAQRESCLKGVQRLYILNYIIYISHWTKNTNMSEQVANKIILSPIMKSPTKLSWDTRVFSCPFYESVPLSDPMQNGIAQHGQHPNRNIKKHNIQLK